MHKEIVPASLERKVRPKHGQSEETSWKGMRARDVNGFKLCYSGGEAGKNGVGILVDRDLREIVVDVRGVNDRLITIKLVVGGVILNVISAYAPQVGLVEDVKRRFWDYLDGVVRGIPHSEKLIIGGDFNGHIGVTARGYDEVHGWFGFGVRNEGSTSLLYFSKAFNLVLANSCFHKREEHLVTFQSKVVRTQIDYLLFRKDDRGLCTDCNVILSECIDAT
uniref:Craniofacial development protein 2-like n=1 Tax=Nicotiana tabacum TaxID=4097 RepID=A0A1S4CD59_TOBAC|nr:PREDICTED: craniofacial development protein 2-like [Nicotiana tabacum]